MKPKSDQQELVSAKELAALAGEEYSTIDHWSGLELLPYSRRGRKRYYDKGMCLKICSRIRALQNEDMNLRAMRVVLRKEFDS